METEQEAASEGMGFNLSLSSYMATSSKFSEGRFVFLHSKIIIHVSTVVRIKFDEICRQQGL